MESSGVLLVILLSCSALCSVLCQEKPKEFKVGEPQFDLKAAGGGKNLRNFEAGFNAGVGTKVWESANKQRSLEVGASYGQSFQRVEGHTFKSKPTYGVGATFRWGRRK